jgi:hypothetical protein
MRYLFLLLLIVFYSIELFAWERVDKRMFGPYSVLIEHDEEWIWHRLTINKNGQQVYQLEKAGHYFNIGNNFLYKEKSIYEIQDINKNGIPDLIISENAMGSVCCHILHIIELGKNVRETKIIAGNKPIRFIDFDNDGIDEIEFWDNVIVGVFASTAGSPLGRVVYRYDSVSNSYKIAFNLMRRELDITWLNKQKQKIAQEANEKTPDLSYAFLETLMNLSYSGHFNKALKTIEEFSPRFKRDASEFKKEFGRILDGSEYWREFSAALKKEKF